MVCDSPLLRHRAAGAREVTAREEDRLSIKCRKAWGKRHLQAGESGRFAVSSMELPKSVYGASVW